MQKPKWKSRPRFKQGILGVLLAGLRKRKTNWKGWCVAYQKYGRFEVDEGNDRCTKGNDSMEKKNRIDYE